MAKVESWYTSFAVRLTERIPRADWPIPESEFWDSLRSAFVRHGITEVVADEASRLLAEKPPQYLDGMLAGLLASCKTVWATSEMAAETPSDRDSAERLSRDCDDCGGAGLTVRFRKLSVGSLDSRGKPVANSITLYCRCPMGRWVENNHAKHSPEIHKRIYDLQDHPFLWGDEYRLPSESSTPPAAPAPSRADVPY